jgi:hypothetical protein
MFASALASFFPRCRAREWSLDRLPQGVTTLLQLVCRYLLSFCLANDINLGSRGARKDFAAVRNRIVRVGFDRVLIARAAYEDVQAVSIFADEEVKFPLLASQHVRIIAPTASA